MTRLNKFALSALIVAYALGPLATQIVTPAVPFVHEDLEVSMAAAQTLVSMAFVAIALATLVYGPLSDRHGRKPVILVGTSLFCTGSVIAAAAPTIGWLIAGRCIQAAGSAAALSLTRTVVHDVYGRERSARALAQLTTVMIFVPMLAPALGGVLLDHAGWRSIFGVCLAAGVIALTLLRVFLPETATGGARERGLTHAFADYRALMADAGYRAPAMQFAWVMAAVFATQAAIPYLVVEVLGGTATEYGIWFAIACVAYVAGNQFTARWGDRFARQRLMLGSGIGCLFSAFAGAAMSAVVETSVASLFVPTTALYFFAGVGIAPLQAEAVAAQPLRSGTASGLLTALQMATGALVVQIIGFAHDGTSRPMFLGLVACTVVATTGGFLRIVPLVSAARRYLDGTLRWRSSGSL